MPRVSAVADVFDITPGPARSYRLARRAARAALRRAGIAATPSAVDWLIRKHADELANEVRRKARSDLWRRRSSARW